MGPFPPALRVLFYKFTGKSTASLQADYWLNGEMMHTVLPSPAISVTEAAWRDTTLLRAMLKREAVLPRPSWWHRLFHGKPPDITVQYGTEYDRGLLIVTLRVPRPFHTAQWVGRVFRRKRRHAKKRLVARLARRDRFAYRRLVNWSSKISPGGEQQETDVLGDETIAEMEFTVRRLILPVELVLSARDKKLGGARNARATTSGTNPSPKVRSG